MVPIRQKRGTFPTSLRASSTMTVLADTLAFKMARLMASLGSSAKACFLRRRLGLAADVDPPRTAAAPDSARATGLLLLPRPTQDAPAASSNPTAAAAKASWSAIAPKFAG